MILTYFRKYLHIAPFTLAIWRSFEAQAVANTASLKSPILDLGCGFGEFAGVFFDSQVEVGIDISREDLEQAQTGKKYKKLVAADARKLPFAAGSFNTVLSLSVLEHIPNTQKALAESYRVLKPGGILVFTVPTVVLNEHLVYPKIFRAVGAESLAQWYINSFHTVFKHFNVWSPQKWVAEVKKVGFTKVTMTGTTPKTIVAVFDALLITGLPSQILRWMFGKRFIVGGGLRNKTFDWLFKILLKDTKLTKSNILIVAHKK